MHEGTAKTNNSKGENNNSQSRTDFVFQWDQDDLLKANNTNIDTHFISSGDKTQSCY